MATEARLRSPQSQAQLSVAPTHRGLGAAPRSPQARPPVQVFWIVFGLRAGRRATQLLPTLRSRSVSRLKSGATDNGCLKDLRAGQALEQRLSKRQILLLYDSSSRSSASSLALQTHSGLCTLRAQGGLWAPSHHYGTHPG